MNDATLAALPAPLDRWATELLGAAPPAERHATCENCAMCSSEPAQPGLRRITFSPRTRCCTYRPPLANHIVGRLLADPLMRAGIAPRLAAGEATPLGVRVPAVYQLLYRHARAAAFGRAESLRCPHQRDDGGCGIWQHRPAVCATWFCKHERGALGAAMWQQLRDTFMAAERALAWWCLDQLGLPPDARRAAADAMDAETLDAGALDAAAPALAPPPLAPAHDAALWGTWAGRASEFYRACAELVAPLGWNAVERIGGAELAAHAAAARRAAAVHAELSLPGHLAAGRFSVIGARDARLWVSTYDDFDPLEVAPELLAFVARCDGRATEDIAAEHAAATGLPVPRRTLRTLVDFGIVTGCAPAPRGAG